MTAEVRFLGRALTSPNEGEKMREEVKKVLASRQEDYGDAETNFTAIGGAWGAALGRSAIQAHEVALMNAIEKIIRIIANPTHADSWVDLDGYLHLAKDIVQKNSLPPVIGD